MSKYYMNKLITVLHVEDSNSDALYVKGMLGNIPGCQFSVKHANYLKEAIELLQQDCGIDVVLLDLLLPDSEGMATIESIMDVAPSRAIVMLTGEGNQDLILEGLRLGAQDYIPKDEISPNLLKRVILAAYDRQHAQEELRMSEQRFQLAVTGTFDGIWDWMIKGDKFWMSEQYYALLGYQTHDFAPSLDAMKESFHPDDRNSFWRGIQRHIKDKDIAYHAEHRMLTKEGEARWFLVRGQAVWDETGEAVRMAGSISDIHDRKRMEAELTESEERYFLAVRGAGVGLWDWNIETDELYWSDKCKRLIGVTYKEFVPNFSFFEERLHPEDRERVLQAVKNHTDNETRYDVQYRLRHKNGEYIWMRARGQAIWDDDGKASRMAGSVADITEQKKAEEEKVAMEVQLRHAHKLEAIGQLAAGIAHEINTPTQFVGDNIRFFQDFFEDLNDLLELYEKLTEAVKSGQADKALVEQVSDKIEDIDLEYLLEEVPEAISQSLDGVTRIRDIVKAMKEFSHPGSANKELSDINQNIQNTVTVSRNEWKYAAEMELVLDPDLPTVECLPNELNQVILNMVVNAAHAIIDVEGDSGNMGRITVTTKQKGDLCEITISDTGAGIPEGIRQRVFDPFFTTKEVGKGTGQGLAIAYSVVVDKHQGTIDVESEVGKGTTFIIRIPVSARTAQNKEQGDGDEAIAVCG